MEVGSLLKVVLVLVVVWIGLGSGDALTDVPLGPLKPVSGLVIVVLIALWLADRI